MDSGILGFGMGIRLKESGIPLNDGNPESKFHWQRLGSSTWIRNPQRDTQNPRLSWIPLHGSDIIRISYVLWVSSSIISFPFFHTYENFECREEWVTKRHSITLYFLFANLLLRLAVQTAYLSWAKWNSMDWNREKCLVWMIFLNGDLNLVRPFWVFVGVSETIVGWILYCNVDIYCLVPFQSFLLPRNCRRSSPLSQLIRNRTAERRGRQNACVTGLLLACSVVIFTYN